MDSKHSAEKIMEDGTLAGVGNETDENFSIHNQIKGKRKFVKHLENCWSGQIFTNFANANLFILSCIAAGLLLITYLGAFSCEVSWLLEARGSLPTSAYLLCAGYFIMFVASTILIHGLVTGLSWGIFSWSVIIGILSIPELAFVMIMTTQYWGLQSAHGLTELIGYLVRLVINCLTLLCVIPTGLKWRRETKVLQQLQTLATRLQLQTPPPSTPMTKVCGGGSGIGGGSNRNSNSKKRRRSRRSSGIDNPTFITNENLINGSSAFSSQNEFNASIFGLNPNQPIMGYPPQNFGLSATRTQSLMDLRYIIPSHLMHSNLQQQQRQHHYFVKPIPNYSEKQFINNNLEQVKNINEKRKNIENLSEIDSINDPIYCTIDNNTNKSEIGASAHTKAGGGSAKLSRNCISLENLGGIEKFQNDLSYGNNLLQNYHLWQMFAFQQHRGNMQQQFPYPYYNYPPSRYQHQTFSPYGGIGYGGFTHPYGNRSNTNSKQSLGQESDDYRKYRDVAL